MFTFIVAIAVVYLFIKINRAEDNQKEIKKSLEILLNKNSQRETENGNISVSKNTNQIEKNTFKNIPAENTPRYVVAGHEYSKSEISEKKEKSHDEFNIGSKIIPAIGILSVLIGVGFFLKYSFDHKLISEMWRVILGFVLGLVFIASGSKLMKFYNWYSQLLIGGGFAILYLSAKFGMVYDLYSNTVGFILMILITAAAVPLSYKINSKLIGFIALIGGITSPFLAASGQANELVLFNYLIILLGGILFLAWKKNWIELVIGSAVGTIILYTASYAEYYSNSVFGIYWGYLLVFFAIFTVAPFLFYFSQKNKKEKEVSESVALYNNSNLILPVIAGGIFMTLSYWMFEQMVVGGWVDNHNTNGLGINTKEGGNEIFENLYFVIGLIPAIFYLALSKVSLKKFKEFGDAKPVYFFISMAAFAIAMIPALQFSGKWITFAWFAEAVVLAMVYYKGRVSMFLNISVVAYTAALFRLLVVDSFVTLGQYSETLEKTVTTFTPIFNERALIYLVAVLSAFAIAFVSFKNNKKNIAKVFGIVGNVTALYWIFIELNSISTAGYLSDDMTSVLLSVVYMAYAVVALFIGIAKKYSGFRIFAIGLFSVVIAKAYFVDILKLGELFRIFAFIILGLVALGIGYYYSKHSEKIKSFLRD